MGMFSGYLRIDDFDSGVVIFVYLCTLELWEFNLFEDEIKEAAIFNSGDGGDSLELRDG